MTPAYSTRTGKAADRLLFRDMLSRLAGTLNFSAYRYVGLGGPFLEDFRILHESFPTMKLSCLESKEQVWRRQRFHKPASHVVLHCCTADYYFANLHDDEECVVVWLDYTNLKHARLREVWGMIPRLCPGSILRVTLRAEGADVVGQVAREHWATELFGKYRPEHSLDELDPGRFPAVLLRAIRKVADDAILETSAMSFQLLHAFVYDDGTQMMTFCGLIGDDDLCFRARKALQSWEFRNFDWATPRTLQLPALSLKERLMLEPLLPSTRGTGRALHKKLGYSIEGSEEKSIEALDQYRILARGYPRFMRLAF